MARKDYDTIKQKFGQYISSWETKNTDLYREIFEPKVHCYFSIAGAYRDGGQHFDWGVKCFIESFPVTDVFHARACNFVCHIKEQTAMQTAAVACTAVNFLEDGSSEAFIFTALFANHWSCKDNEWRMDQMRMEICGESGEMKAFKENWFFDAKEIKFRADIHYPVINGELDSPWFALDEYEDVLTEEERIDEIVFKYFFGTDMLSFQHVDAALAEDLRADMQPWGCMNKRHYLECLKFHRQKDRMWAHPVRRSEIVIHGDTAHGIYNRMSGHALRTHPYVYTLENADIETACGYMVYDFKKTDGKWEITTWNYYLGMLQLGSYEGDVYGELKSE